MSSPRENDDYEKVREDSHAFDGGERDQIKERRELRWDSKVYHPPGWVPCLHCLKPWRAHVDLQCPFDSTKFSPDNTPEIWEIFHDAVKVCGYETKRPLADFNETDQSRFYMEAAKRHLLRQLKRKESADALRRNLHGKATD